MSNSAILELLATLFPPNSASPDWPGFVVELSRELDDAVCMVWSTGTLSEPIAAHPRSVVDASSKYVSSAETQREFLREAEYPVGVVAELSRGADVARDGGRFRREVLDPAEHAAGTSLVIPLAGDGRLITAVLIIVFRTGSTAGARAVPLLTRLMPWILYAAGTMLAERRRSDQTLAMRQTVDHLSAGLILLDGNGNVIFANRSAASQLEGSLVPSFLADVASEERAVRLNATLDHMLEPTGQRDGKPTARGGPRLLFSRMQVDDTEARPFGGRVAAVILISPSGGDPRELLDEIQGRYGLTPAEARLAVQIGSGKSLDEAAVQLGVTVGTLRTRLKQVFAKTGTNRQASLVRLLMAEEGPLRAD